MSELYVPTDYARLREVIQAELDRDGTHDWDENARLAEMIAARVWNELHAFPASADEPRPRQLGGEPQRHLPASSKMIEQRRR